RDRTVLDLAQRHPVAAPAALISARRRVVNRDAFLVDDVQLVGDFVELEAPLVDDVARLLIVLGHSGGSGWRTMIEIPYELAVPRELQDAVFIGFAADPDEPF